MIESAGTVRGNGVSAAGGSDPGRVRADNEDRMFFDVERGVYLVVDGVGGHAAGEVAAAIATQVIDAALTRIGTDPERQIREAITLANNEIHDQAARSPEHHGMACVLTLAVVSGRRLTIGHVGDSRLYKLTPRGMCKLTHDHSPVGTREDDNEISEIEAMYHPRRNEVFRDVGGIPHGPDDEEFVEIVTAEFGPEDALLLCSDGLSDMLVSTTIERIVRQHAGDPAAVVSRLIAAANDAGGKDNVTAVYVEGTSFASAPAADGSFAARVGALARALMSSRATWAIVGLLAGLLLALGAALRNDGVALPGRSRTLVVGHGDPAAYASIAAAVRAARRHDVIALEPGEYAEAVVLGDGVDLRATVPGMATLVAPPGRGAWVSVEAPGGTGNTISGIRIAGRGDAPIGTGIAVGGNNVLVEDVAIDGDVDVGVSVRSGEARLVASRFTDVRGVPVTIAAGARPALRQNLFVRDGEERGPAVHVQGDARPTIVDNTFVGYQEPVGGPQEVRDRAAADNYRVHGPAHAPVPLPAPQRRTP
jgi:serine/threonine protein phosphatase PrpC